MFHRSAVVDTPPRPKCRLPRSCFLAPSIPPFTVTLAAYLHNEVRETSSRQARTRLGRLRPPEGDLTVYEWRRFRVATTQLVNPAAHARFGLGLWCCRNENPRLDDVSPNPKRQRGKCYETTSAHEKSRRLVEFQASAFDFTHCLTNQAKKLRGPDSNRRPRGYEPRELPGCSTPRHLNE
jgi:hypothetical protein